jgi:hypothetical protein
MSYEKYLREAIRIARSIHYEPILGKGESSGTESKTFANYWILNTTYWRDIGLWIDTETWND